MVLVVLITIMMSGLFTVSGNVIKASWEHKSLTRAGQRDAKKRLE